MLPENSIGWCLRDMIGPAVDVAAEYGGVVPQLLISGKARLPKQQRGGDGDE